VSADLADLTTLPGLVAAAIDRFGRIDALVNTVGGVGPAPLMATTAAVLEESFHLNVTVAYELSRLVAPYMLAVGGGSIVNTSSAMGHLRERGFAAYATGKGALEHLTRQLSADLAPRIRVNAIAPGAILTASLRGLLTPEVEQQMVALTPLRRLGTPEDIALSILYLVSDAGSYVTGKVLEVDGGLEASNLPLGIPDLEMPA
jgi:7-alpha-hydroxysteroid dehydrogenase